MPKHYDHKNHKGEEEAVHFRVGEAIEQINSQSIDESPNQGSD
jgi:hypothetical protein